MDPPNKDKFIPKSHIDKVKFYSRDSNPKFSRDTYIPEVSRGIITPKTTQRKLTRTTRKKIGRQSEVEKKQIYKVIEDIKAAGEEQKTNKRLKETEETEEEQYNEWITPRRKDIPKPKRRLKGK